MLTIQSWLALDKLSVSSKEIPWILHHQGSRNPQEAPWNMIRMERGQYGKVSPRKHGEFLEVSSWWLQEDTWQEPSTGGLSRIPREVPWKAQQIGGTSEAWWVSELHRTSPFLHPKGGSRMHQCSQGFVSVYESSQTEAMGQLELTHILYQTFALLHLQASKTSKPSTSWFGQHQFCPKLRWLEEC